MSFLPESNNNFSLILSFLPFQYCNNINESAAESAKNVTNGVKTIFAKIIANVFEEVGDDGKNPMMIDLVNFLFFFKVKIMSRKMKDSFPFFSRSSATHSNSSALKTSLPPA